MEEDGKFFDAVRCYKRATQMVPDIEKKVFNFTKRRAANRNQG